MKQNNIKDKNITKLQVQQLENLFNIYNDEDGMYYYNLNKTVNFPDDLDPNIYGVYTTEPKDTWPLIAYKFYKNVRLWWLICAVNNIINPVAQPENGTQLKILSVEVVRSILTQVKDG